ncbi:MAG: Ig-like domain-containing protein [Xanthomonadales bacterium]|nr:Ig-like domain-containing protein [Xanthomonadales bacterium]
MIHEMRCYHIKQWLTFAVVIGGILLAGQSAAQSLALVYDRATQAEHLAYVDAAGMPTLLNTGNSDCCRVNAAVHTELSSRDQVAFIGSDFDGSNTRLIVHRLSDGGLQNEVATPAGHDILALSFDSGGDRLLALGIEVGVGNLSIFEVDTAAGSWTSILDLGNDCCAMQVGLSTFDEENRIWYFSARTQGATEWSLFQFNAINNTSSSVVLAADLFGLEFVNGAAYGLLFDSMTNTTTLATVNMIDGSVSPIGAGVSNCCETIVGATSTKTINDTLQFIGRDVGATTFSLYAANLIDGSIQNVVALSDSVIINAWLGNSRPFIAQGGSVNVMVLEDTPAANFGLILDSSDVENAGLSWSISESASEGSAMVTTGNGLQQAIQYQANADYFGSDNFRVQVQDNTGDQDSIEVVVNVAPVNDAPSFTIGPNQTHDDDVGAVVLSNWATNLDVGAANEAGQTLSFIVVGNSAPGLFDVAPAVSSTGELSYTVASGSNGTAQIDLRLMDDGGTANGGVDTSAILQFTVTVNSVSPIIMEGAEALVTMSEDANPAPFALTLNATDPLAGTLSWSISVPAQFGVASVSNGSGNSQAINYQPNADANGQDEFHVQVLSSSGRSNSIRVLVDVVAINDAPSFNLGPDVATVPVAGAQLFNNWAQNISAGPANESAQNLNFVIEAISDPTLFDVTPVVNTAGDLSFTPAPGAQGEVLVSLRLMDDGGTDNGGIDRTATMNFNIAVGLATTTDLVLTMSDGAGHADQNAVIVYDIQIVNQGFENAVGAPVMRVLPPQLSNASWSCVASGGAACSANGNGNLQDVIDIPSGGMVSYQLSATVIGQEGESIFNQVEVVVPAGLTDLQPQNNSATDENVIGLFFDSFESMPLP